MKKIILSFCSMLLLFTLLSVPTNAKTTRYKISGLDGYTTYYRVTYRHHRTRYYEKWINQKTRITRKEYHRAVNQGLHITKKSFGSAVPRWLKGWIYKVWRNGRVVRKIKF